MPFDQHVRHRTDQQVGQRQVGVQRVKVLDAARVGEDQEAVVEILVEDAQRGVGLGKQSGNMDEETAVFLLRRRVHQDTRAAVRPGQAEIAAEAGVYRGRGDLDVLVREALATQSLTS